MGMKDIATSLTQEFSKAVAKQEQDDAHAIQLITGKMNAAYYAYSTGLEGVREKQISLGEQYRACLELEGQLQNTFEREMQELNQQLAFFKHRKTTPSHTGQANPYAAFPQSAQVSSAPSQPGLRGLANYQPVDPNFADRG